MPNPSAITETLSVDDPLAQDANYEFDSDDRQYIDNQIRGIQKHLVAGLIRGVHGTYVRLAGSSGGVQPGDTVCLVSTAGVTEATATKSSLEALVDAGTALGVVLLAAAPGAYVLIATSGAVSPSVTGLDTVKGFARVNPTTSRLERVAAVGTGDYSMGAIASSGWLRLQQDNAIRDEKVEVIPVLGHEATDTDVPEVVPTFPIAIGDTIVLSGIVTARDEDCTVYGKWSLDGLAIRTAGGLVIEGGSDATPIISAGDDAMAASFTAAGDDTTVDLTIAGLDATDLTWSWELRGQRSIF